MLTRREVMSQALVARSLLAKEIHPNFAVPPDACDCHTHIIGDPRRFPFFPGRVYTPPMALPREMAALHRVLHIRRVVIVTPSVYGTDNSATLYGLRARGGNARGVAVIDEKTDLDQLASAGVRGIRLNFGTGAQTNLTRERVVAALDRIRNRNWHLQMYANLAVIANIGDLVTNSPAPFVFDHFGGAKAALGLDQPGFSHLIELVRSGRAYVKISGAYRASTLAPDYPDVAPFAKALIAANANRVVWGTDWPHPDSSPSDHPTPRLAVDDVRLFNQLPVWAPDLRIRQKILVENPARLYGWD